MKCYRYDLVVMPQECMFDKPKVVEKVPAQPEENENNECGLMLLCIFCVMYKIKKKTVKPKGKRIGISTEKKELNDSDDFDNLIGVENIDIHSRSSSKLKIVY